MIIGELLEKYRKQDNISLRQQAAKLEISPSYLCDIIKGNRNLTYEVFKKIIKSYKYRCVGEDFVKLGLLLNSPDVFNRFKRVSGFTEDEKAMKQFIYIITGDIL